MRITSKLLVLSSCVFPFFSCQAKDFLDYNDFEPFQKAITYEEALPRMRFLFADDEDFRFSSYWFNLTRDSLAIYASAAKKAAGDSEYVYFFGNQNPPIRTPGFTPKRVGNKPLAGVRIALDPGHFGGPLASREGRHTVNKQLGIDFNEGDLALNTARRIRNLLEPLGAEIMITRPGSGLGAFPMTYEEWKKNPDVVRAAVEEVARDNTYPNDTAAELESSKHWSDNRIFFDAYLRVDRIARVEKINAFKPHLTFIIHYNASGQPEFTTTADRNLGYTPGGLEARRMNYKNARQALLRLLISDEVEKSKELCKLVVRKMDEKTGLGAYRKSVFESEDAGAGILQDAVLHGSGELTQNYLSQELLQNVIYPWKDGRDLAPAVRMRNLDISTFALGASCYGESLFQDNLAEAKRLNEKDFIVDGVATSKRVDQVAHAYSEAALEFLGFDKSLLDSI